MDGHHPHGQILVAHPAETGILQHLQQQSGRVAATGVTDGNGGGNRGVDDGPGRQGGGFSSGGRAVYGLPGVAWEAATGFWLPGKSASACLHAHCHTLTGTGIHSLELALALTPAQVSWSGNIRMLSTRYW